MEMQISLIFTATEGFLDDVPVLEVSTAEKNFKGFLQDKHSSFLEKLRDEKKMTAELKTELKKILTEFKAVFKETKS